ncbi:hypothetical protein Taro_056108, partial [Colocasia esculenta]|nr:hypothetical protein [Colocasia esculenta]
VLSHEGDEVYLSLHSLSLCLRATISQKEGSRRDRLGHPKIENLTYVTRRRGRFGTRISQLVRGRFGTPSSRRRGCFGTRISQLVRGRFGTPSSRRRGRFGTLPEGAVALARVYHSSSEVASALRALEGVVASAHVYIIALVRGRFGTPSSRRRVRSGTREEHKHRLRWTRSPRHSSRTKRQRPT